MNFKKIGWKNLYSARGAKRGLWLAGAGIVFWSIWAAGYIQGRLDLTPIVSFQQSCVNSPPGF